MLHIRISNSVASFELYRLLSSELICLFQKWVYGNSFQSFLVAVVNPNK
ncbi:hypothetical protein SOVF_146770 [Spinacia oleracea]|nr:hypothetical protein SOVF_146770 [Spinacia oleracea]